VNPPLPTLPEPLQTFDGLRQSVSPALHSLQAAYIHYRSHKDAGRILPNSVEALRIEFTYHSNAIEGSTLSLRETQLIIEGLAPTSGKTLREIYEARNHDRALRMIEAWAQSRDPAAPLTVQDILETHAHILADIDPRSAGLFRTERVLIKGTRFIPPASRRFDDLVAKMLELANRPPYTTFPPSQPDPLFHHPALEAAELHYNFVAIHPFNDGNGRTARLLLNYHLLRHGYPLTIIEVEQRSEYLAALEEANAGRLVPFATFILQCVERSILRILGPA